MLTGIKNLFVDRRTKQLVISLNVIAVIFVVVFRLNFPEIGTNELFLYSNDATAYLKVANWIKHPHVFLDHLQARQFFYPLIVFLIKSIGGFGLMVLFQVFLWLISVNLIFLTVLKVTRISWLSFAAGLLFVSHVGMIALLFHGLTETLTVTLLALLCAIILWNRKDLKNIKVVHGLLFVLSLLTATKAMFSVVWILSLVLIAVFYFQFYRKRPKALIWLALVLVPAFLQMGIMKFHFDSWTFSKVGGKTITNYLYVQGLTGTVDLERAALIEYAQNQSEDEKLSYIMNNKERYVRHFFENVFYNLKSISYLIPEKGQVVSSDSVRKLSGMQNAIFLILHIIGVLLVVVTLILKKQPAPTMNVYMMLWSLLLFTVFISGISFWQGDRLTVPAIPILLMLYPILGMGLFIRSKK